MIDQIDGAALRCWRAEPPRMVRDLFGATPDGWQDEVLEAFPHNQRIALKASKGPGKTSCLAWLAWNFLLTRPHPKIAATSITRENLGDNLWTEMAKWQAKSDLLKAAFEWQKTRIICRDHPETWWMSARSWARGADPQQQADTLAGLHADYVLFLLDESGGIPAAVMAAAEAALATGIESHIVQAGNPIMLDGPLYAACTTERRLWRIFEINGDPDDPKRSSRVSIEWAREQIEKYGKDNPWVLVNVFGRFPPSSINTLIGPDEVTAATKRGYKIDQIAHAARTLGVDVARFGDDSNIIFPRQGLVAFTPLQYRNLDSFQIAGAVARKWADWEADACFIDDTGGWAVGAIDALRQLGRSPICVPFSGEANDRRYYNKRAEMAFECVAWIKSGGQLPECPELAAALTKTTYTFKGDRLLLEPKEQVKEKLGYSPDHMDGLCFVAGTLVETPVGPVPIERLQPGDLVITPFGPTAVAANWASLTERLTTATFSNGGRLIGKGSHRIFIWGAGSAPLDALPLTVEVEPYGRWRCGLWRAASALCIEARRTGFKQAVDTISRGSELTGSAFFIAACGWTATALFRRLSRFITSMAIGATMRLATSPSLIAAVMRSFIPQTAAARVESGEFLSLPLMKQPNGTPQNPGALGTASTLLPAGDTARSTASYANGAGRLSGPFGPKKPASARSVACRPKRIGAISPRLVRAIGAGARLLRIVIGIPPVVPVHVQTENVRPTAVYNLTLERHNVYYAGGVLAYNCLTFAQPVLPRGFSAHIRSAVHHRVEYDPYAETRR